MAQSINTKVEYTGKGVSYLGIGGKVGKFLLGDRGFEFYNDANVEHFIQIPWTSIIEMGANVSRKRSVAILKSLLTRENFSLHHLIQVKF